MGKRLLIFLIVMLSITRVHAQFKADVSIAAIEDKGIRANMTEAATEIINEINYAFKNNLQIKNPNESLIQGSAFHSLSSMWQVNRFKVTQTQLVVDGLHMQNGGYEIRNIPIYFENERDENQEREIAFTFDKNGKMVYCFLCLESNTVYKLLHNHSTVTELRQREIILDFLEKFRTAYNTRDADFIENVFSDDALIIVGKIVQEVRKASDMLNVSNMPIQKVQYNTMNKDTFMYRLRRAFSSKQFIKVDFDSIAIERSSSRPEIYGVTLWQSWKSSGYNDLGWLFLLVDFKNIDSPLIYIRTWQPGILNGKPFPRDKVYNLDKFDTDAGD